ncbi:MAG: sugar transferase [Clostridiales bacterium]|nr:sugar transferase [Clostridiales bacterium]
MYKKFGKRLLDIVISLIALPFVGLVILIFAPIIYLTDKGPVFYNAPRRGMNGKNFKMFKLRSMKVNSPVLKNADGSTYSGDDDPRVTKIGRIMRKLSIDELPQILNVLIGDMSFVGPRPNLATGNYAEFDEVRKKRLTVRPGITGYSQAYFRNSITQDEKFANDCYYVDHLSFIFDVKILIQTVLSVVGSKNINYKESNQKKDVAQ